MTDSEMFEQVGKTRFNYREAKKELGALKAKALEWAKLAATIAHGLENPEMIRWWEGMPLVGQRPEHVIFTSAMFRELTEANMKQLCQDIKRVTTSLKAMRQQLTEMDEDPEGRASGI